MKKRTFLLVALASILTMSSTLEEKSFGGNENNSSIEYRMVDVDNSTIELQSFFDEFDSYNVQSHNNVITFIASKKCDFVSSSVFDYVADDETSSAIEYEMNYFVSMDLSNNTVESNIDTIYENSCNSTHYCGDIVTSDEGIVDFVFNIEGEKYYANDLLEFISDDNYEECGFTPNLAIKRETLAMIIDITIAAISLVCAIVSAAVVLKQAITISKGLVRNVLTKQALKALKDLIKGPLRQFLGSLAGAVLSCADTVLGILFDFSIGNMIAYIIDYADCNRLNGICFG